MSTTQQLSTTTKQCCENLKCNDDDDEKASSRDSALRYSTSYTEGEDSWDANRAMFESLLSSIVVSWECASIERENKRRENGIGLGWTRK